MERMSGAYVGNVEKVSVEPVHPHQTRDAQEEGDDLPGVESTKENEEYESEARESATGKFKGEQTTGKCALRDAVIYYYIGQTTIALRRNALVVDTTNEERCKENDEANSAVMMSQ
jgi:hypothetical protein